jgi:hypothetical protein
MFIIYSKHNESLPHHRTEFSYFSHNDIHLLKDQEFSNSHSSNNIIDTSTNSLNFEKNHRRTRKERRIESKLDVINQTQVNINCKS